MNNRKTMTILMLALLIVGLTPVALAHHAGEDEGLNLQVRSRADIRTETRIGGDDDGNDSETRVETRTRARSRVEARSENRASREEFIEARSRVRGSNAGIEARQKFLVAAADRVIDLLERLQERLEDSEASAEVTAEIETSIEEVSELREEASSLENATREDISQMAREIREAWVDARLTLRKGVASVKLERVGNVVQRMEALENRLERVIEGLNGSDAESAAELKAEFDAKLEEARIHLEASQELFSGAEGERDVQAANEEMREAQEDLKEAHQILMELVRDIRDTSEDAFEDDSDESDEKEETRVEVSGDVELSAEAQATLDELVASFEGQEGEVELELKAVKQANASAAIEHAEVEEGSLTEAQMELWSDLQSQVLSVLDAAEGDDLELEIEIEHELEVEGGEDADAEDDSDDDDDQEADESDDDESDAETSVSVEGDVELSSESQAALDSLIASFLESESSVELKLEADKSDNQTTIEASIEEGSLTESQTESWEELQDAVRDQLENSEETDLELEIEIEHEV